MFEWHICIINTKDYCRLQRNALHCVYKLISYICSVVLSAKIGDNKSLICSFCGWEAETDRRTEGQADRQRRGARERQRHRMRSTCHSFIMFITYVYYMLKSSFSRSAIRFIYSRLPSRSPSFSTSPQLSQLSISASALCVLLAAIQFNFWVEHTAVQLCSVHSFLLLLLLNLWIITKCISCCKMFRYDSIAFMGKYI